LQLHCTEIPEEINKVPLTDLKEMVIYKVPENNSK
jgi:hypothetical protein